MEAVLYASVSGALILVPECFAPSNDLEHVHGRLMPCGRISLEEEAYPDLCRRIGLDFDRMSYCVLGARDVDRLFAAKALWKLYERRRTPRETSSSGPRPAKHPQQAAQSTLDGAGSSAHRRPASQEGTGVRFWTSLRAFLHLPAAGGSA